VTRIAQNIGPTSKPHTHPPSSVERESTPSSDPVNPKAEVNRGKVNDQEIPTLPHISHESSDAYDNIRMDKVMNDAAT